MSNKYPLTIDNQTMFHSITKGNLTFDDVYESILDFINKEPTCKYRISIGTDSQVGKSTVFVTCIHIHRVGKGAIGFFHKTYMKRPIHSLKEKIYTETSITLQLAYLFDNNKLNYIREILKRNNSEVDFEFHIDIGQNGKTRFLIKEMIGMVAGLEFVPRIKPDSYCASSYADRHTKVI